MSNLMNVFSSKLRSEPVAIFIFCRPLFDFFNKMSAQTQPRVKKKRRNWSKGEDAVLMTKAITYYKLKEDEISKIFTKTMLVKEAAAAYGIPESVFRLRINDKLATDEGQGVGTALSKENEEKETEAKRSKNDYRNQRRRKME